MHLITPATPNFAWDGSDAIACPRTAMVRADIEFFEAIEALQAVRDRWGAGITITSCFRDGYYNAVVDLSDDDKLSELARLDENVTPVRAWRSYISAKYGDDVMGAAKSKHLLGSMVPTFDIVASGRSKHVAPRMPRPHYNELVAAFLFAAGFNGIGVYDEHIHADRRDKVWVADSRSPEYRKSDLRMRIGAM